jgi:uncharacterized protein YggE
VLAAAAGGTLGALLAINPTQETAMPTAFAAVAVSARRGPSTQITPDQITVTATVTGVWRYIAGPGAANH